MKFNTILLEATYNLDFVDDISNYILQKYKNKNVEKLTKISITNFLPAQLNPKKIKIHFRYKTSPENVQFVSEPFYYEDDEGEDKLDGFQIMYVDAKPFNKYSTEEIKQFKETMKHEMTHILDYIRGNGKSKNIDMEKSGSNQMTYYSDPSEINALINLLKIYKEKNPVEYNSIKTYKSLLYTLIKIGQSRHETPNNEVLNNEKLKQKLIKRLAKENLIPKSLVF